MRRFILKALVAALVKAVEEGTIEGGRVWTTPRPTSGPWLKSGTYLVVPVDRVDKP